MKKRWILLGLVLFQTILTGCASKTPQLPDECLAQNMLISKEDIGALEEYALFSPMSDEPANSATISFQDPGLGSTFIIQHYDRNIESAYDNYSEFAFQTDEHFGPWIRPGDLTFESTAADEFEYRCGRVWDEIHCIYVARYRNYLVDFGLIIGPEDFSLENFESGMAAIDREAAECFAALEEATP
ncbi:MAG TPA: hypothetical protein PKL11_10910 [Anaerolineaceae bacterium]|nr:hypothetical protein [Anaerolineaceae bacterium]